MALHRWVREGNYLGTDFSDYYVAAVVVPNAGDTLDESNYAVIKQRLIDAGHPFREEWFGHWAVGRYDVLLIHQSDTAALSFAADLHAALDEYPILDEEDFDARGGFAEDEG